jgi:hypothetical protein
MPKLKTDANKGGKIAGGAREKLEKELGRSVISRKNYLDGGDKIEKLK